MIEDKYIIISYTVNSSSVSDYFTALSNKFLAEGYRIIVFTEKKKIHSNLDREIIVKYWYSKRIGSFRNILILYQTIKKYKPVLTISIFGSVNLFLIIGFILKVPYRIAWIRTLSTQFYNKKWKILRKILVYKLATQIIVNSKATKADAVKTYYIKPSKISVLPNSVKREKSVSSNLFDKSKLVYAGRLHPSKGIDVLILAMEILHKKGYSLYLDIIGDGILKPKLEKMVVISHLPNQILFLGERSKMEVLQSFKSAYCVIVPSNSEAFGFTVIEAMSMTTAVIGANNTGIKEIILDNISGLLFETGNHVDLADKIELLILNEKFRNSLAQNAYQRFLDFYESDYAIDRDFQFFKEYFLDRPLSKI